MDCRSCNGTGEVRDQRAERKQAAEEEKQTRAAQKAAKAAKQGNGQAKSSATGAGDTSLRSFKSRCSIAILSVLLASPFVMTDGAEAFFARFFPDAPILAGIGCLAAFGFLLPRIAVALMVLMLAFLLYANLS